jgi:hypothetical protein
MISVAITLALWPLMNQPYMHRILLGFVGGVLYEGISFPLWRVLRYTDYSSQKPLQATTSYLALGLSTVSLWIGANFVLFYLISSDNDISWLRPLVPLLVLIGSLLFTILALIYHKWLLEIRARENEMELDEMEKSLEQQTSEKPKELIERIAIKVGQKIEVVPIEDILFIQAEGDYTMIHTAKSRFLKEQTMKHFEEHLPSGQFIRVHRSYIVNILSVSKIELYEKQTHLITLKNGFQIKASVAGYKLLKKTLGL